MTDKTARNTTQSNNGVCRTGEGAEWDLDPSALPAELLYTAMDVREEIATIARQYARLAEKMERLAWKIERASL